MNLKLGIEDERSRNERDASGSPFLTSGRGPAAAVEHVAARIARRRSHNNEKLVAARRQQRFGRIDVAIVERAAEDGAFDRRTLALAQRA